MNDSKVNKEITLINKRLLYDFLEENKFQVYSYIFLILFSYPLNSIVISNFFSELVESFDKKQLITKQVQFYQKNYINTSKGILSKIIFLLRCVCLSKIKSADFPREEVFIIFSNLSSPIFPVVLELQYFCFLRKSFI